MDERIADCQRRIAAYREALAAVRENPDLGVKDLEPFRELAAQQALLTGPKPTGTELFSLMSTFSKSSGRTAEQMRQEVLETLERLVKREEANLAQLRAKRERAGLEPDFRAERERLLYALPEPNDVKLVIRYETMLTRDRDKAVAELDRLQRQQE